jgi:Zn finger protein HypA/HybF involved in hydrogenase expression
MKVCTCENCRFTFRYPILPLACPDCGHDAVRLATEKELSDYYKMQEIIKEEIRLGLYPAGNTLAQSFSA